MSTKNRYMRILLFFDLPVETSTQRRNYRLFRKKLISLGFIMEQYSVYSKLVLNNTVADSVMGTVRAACPKEGTIQILIITEKQYAKIEYIIGGKTHKTVDTEERLLVL